MIINFSSEWKRTIKKENLYIIYIIESISTKFKIIILIFEQARILNGNKFSDAFKLY